MDLAIEQTMNCDTKTKGGIVGFTTNPRAVLRWAVIAHERDNTVRACHDMAAVQRSGGEERTTYLPKEL